MTELNNKLIESLHAELDMMIERLAQNGIKQRSEAWHKDKADNIGGSSIATIMGLGYKRLGEFIREKAIPPPTPARAIDIEETAAMNWGTVFEDVLCTYIEKQYNCTIKGTELYYRDYEKFPHLCYSPDGLGVFEVGAETCSMEVQTEDGVEYITEIIKRPSICLFEFKCPWSRIPAGKPPNYYVPQVKMGLQMLEGATHGVFAEGVFRHCTRAQLGFGPEFNKSVSTRNGTPINRRTGWGLPPLACGILVFTGPAIPSHVDLGTVPLNVLKEVIYNAAKGAYEINFEIFLAGEEIKHVERQPALILPWKLFRVDVHTIDKEPEYLNPWYERIAATVQTIARVRAEPTRADEIINAFFA